MNIVLDTNVLVSALWSSANKPAAIVNAVLSRRFTVCYDYRILEEYTKVLRRPKFGFSEWEIQYLLDAIAINGISVIADPVADVPFVDESDRKFYEVSQYCFAVLVTGNTRHYPASGNIMTVSDFYDRFIGR